MSVLVVGSREERLEKDWNHYKKRVLDDLELLDIGMRFFMTPENNTPSMERVMKSIAKLRGYIELFKISIRYESPLVKKFTISFIRDGKIVTEQEYSNTYAEGSEFCLTKRVLVSVLNEAAEVVNEEIEKIKKEIGEGNKYEVIFDIARDFDKIIDDYLE